MHTLVPTVVEMMKVPYPDLAKTAKSVVNVIEEEESQFFGVVEKGLSKFERCVEKARSSNSGKISGDDAFDLHQTDGFLIELTEAMAAKKNLAVDLERFKLLMNQHKIGSGSGAFLDSVMAEGPLDAVRKSVGSTTFLGYDKLEAEGEIVGIIAEKQLVDQLEEVGRSAAVGIVLDRTPFYGEAGGQVGDTGTLTADGSEFEVIDTQRDGGLILHVGHLKRGRLQVGQKLQARVDGDRRAAIRRAHSATHLLHYALRKNLGETATQRGSKVEQDQFRFDFAHKRALTPDEILKIEDDINARIAEGAPVQTQLMKLDEAKKAGAMALFGEKYPDPVRVVSMGQFSVELCGGTHLTNTGQVGFLKIVSEEPVAKGVRRVVAMTGPRALQRVRDAENLLKELVAAAQNAAAGRPAPPRGRAAGRTPRGQEAARGADQRIGRRHRRRAVRAGRGGGRREDHRPRHRRDQSRYAPRVHRSPARQREARWRSSWAPSPTARSRSRPPSART